MTRRGIVVEGNYQIGDRVLLVFDEASRRYLPTYRRKKGKGREEGEFHAARYSDDTTKEKCLCTIMIEQDDRIFAGDNTVAIADLVLDGCKIPPDEEFVEWELTGSGCTPVIVSIQGNILTWRVDTVGSDSCLVTVKAKFRGEQGKPECEDSVIVHVIGCQCNAELELSPGDKVGNLETVTASLNITYEGCSGDAISSVRVTWDVRILSCSGECDYEIVSQSDSAISVQPSISEGAWAVFGIQATVDGDNDIPFCEAYTTFYVGCACDVAVTVPYMIAPGLVYNGTIKGWYYDCSEAEKTPLSYWFHDCETNGMGCGVTIFEDVEVSEDPPEHRITFGVNPDAGSGSVKFTGQIGSEGNIPFCEQTAHIVIDCCLKLAEDRIVILYTDPEDVETIGVNQEVYLWVDMVEDGGCPPFKWSFDGPGEFEVSEDTTSATYKAPDYDGYDTCAGAKVTIGVQDACGSGDEVKMSINAIFTNEVAYRIARVIDRGPGGSWCNNCPTAHWKYYFHWIWGFTWGFDNYNCAGDYLSWSWGNNCIYCQSHSGGTISSGCDILGGNAGKDCTMYGPDPYCCGSRSDRECWGAFWSSICPGGPVPRQLWCATCGMVLDCRSELMKQLKCCPGALPD